MKKKNKGSISALFIFRNIVAALFAINLILLFVFDYNVPGFSYLKTKIENYRDHIDGIASGTNVTDGNVIFSYESDVLKYSGKKKFNPVADVTVKDSSGNELDPSCLTAKVTGETAKEILYSYQSEDGQFYGSDTRKLELENYSGPVIVLSGDVPALTDKNLGKLDEICDGIYTATDGYDNDITGQVTMTATPTTAFNGTFHVQFSVTNVFGDTAKAEADVKTKFKKPHLMLTCKKINIKKGEKFNPVSYILYAVDADGSDLSDDVETDGEVDNDTPGDYLVTYDLSNKAGKKAKTKKLKVHVVEE